MSRLTLAIDRLATFLLALVFLALAGLALLWWHGGWSGLPRSVSTSSVSRATGTSWWPWAAGVGGLILAVLAIRWLLGHIPVRSVGELTLAGGSSAGRLAAQSSTIVQTAGEVFSDTPGVRSVRSRMIRERGQRVADFRAVIEPEADLGVVARSADVIAADMRGVTGRADLYCRIHLKVAARQRQQVRVS